MQLSGTSNIALRLDDVAARYPERLAIAWPRRPPGSRQVFYTRVTFAEMAEQVRRMATALVGLGLRRGDRVVVLTPVSPDLYVIVLGLFRSGLTAVFLDPWRGRRHVDDCCAAVTPAGFIGSAAALTLCQRSGEFRRIPTKILVGPPAIPGTHQLHQLLRSAPPDSSVVPTDSDDAALITLT